MPVFEPMMGEHPYVAPEHFTEFLQAVRTFFTDLADALERVQNERERLRTKPLPF